MSDPLAAISVYLEPTKRKLTLDLAHSATVGDVVQGMVTHLSQTDGFDIGHFLREKIGDGQQAEWQLFRERENMMLLPPDVRFGELQPPLEDDELFTLKVNAKVATAADADRGEVNVIVHYTLEPQEEGVRSERVLSIPWPGSLAGMLRVLAAKHGGESREYHVYDVHGNHLRNPEQPISAMSAYRVETRPLRVADAAESR